MSSANTSNFDLSKILLCGKEFILYQATKLDYSKLKAFADGKINVTENLNFVFEKMENLVEKGENACYQHFLFFSTTVFKSCLFQSC